MPGNTKKWEEMIGKNEEMLGKGGIAWKYEEMGGHARKCEKIL